MVGAHAGDMIGKIALAIETGAVAVGIGNTAHPSKSETEKPLKSLLIK